MSSEELMLQGSDVVPSDWSSDGHTIVYQEGDRKPEMWILPLEGDRKPFLVEQTEFVTGRGAFSPDGRWLAYASSAPKERTEIYVRAFTGKPGTGASGGKWLISNGGGSRPRWRRDGKEVFYRLNDGKLMPVEIKGGAKFEAGVPKLLFDTRVLSVSFDVTADGQRFIVNTPVDQAQFRSPITVVLNWQAALKK
jgi:dipeptidyl aminopeptidase/acylaminoacyl peptidase